jgi:DNA excision repair protein ERCC-6
MSTSDQAVMPSEEVATSEFMKDSETGYQENTEAAAAVADVALDDNGDDGENDETEANDEASVLKGLTEGVRDQDDLQRDITYQANLFLIEQEDERDQKRIDKVKSSKHKLLIRRRNLERKLDSQALNTLIRGRLQTEIEKIDADVAVFENDIFEIQRRIDARHQHEQNVDDHAERHGNRRLPNETQREFLIRTGKITPFARMPERNIEGVSGELAEAIMEAEEEAEVEQLQEDDTGPKSHQNLRRPGFREEPESEVVSEAEEISPRPRKKRRLQNANLVFSARGAAEDTLSPTQSREQSTDDESTSNFTPGSTDIDLALDMEADDSGVDFDRPRRRPNDGKAVSDVTEDLTGIDDGNEEVYQSRLQSWVDKRSRARRNKQKDESSLTRDNKDFETAATETDEEEWFRPSPDAPDHQFENGLELPGDIYPALFDYQKTGVQWLGELYAQQVGGIVGDEMGLGKTIQIISFLAGLHYSKKLTKPVIVVAPATVLRQWVNEFHIWWPPLRVSILHTSGSGMLNVRNERRLEDYEEPFHSRRGKKPSKQHKLAKGIVGRVVEQGHVLVTTYAGLQTYSDILIPVEWDYAVLDEGHKIRNPNTAITYYCKQLRTANRVILSGTPMQNNLIELWSLFDFVYPMRLGTLVNFRDQFEVPIKLGGYANATNLQIMTAEKCAITLKDTISPYLLHRVKADVAADLPNKSEQVLFCKLTKPQREAYEMFLNSDEMASILNRRRQSLYGIDILRKICNHPDLLDPKLKTKPGYRWGNPNKSGKMQVVKKLLDLWKKNGDKALLFSQGVQMLDVIEGFVRDLAGINYLRMDGSTNIKDRQSMVDRFNHDPDLHVFLLTTKVGGLGVNLTGANRVIIFDPDWNPSTDIQARERAWRLGQKKEVAIYRLMTKGTIEEKIYHRQIYKQFLTDKILKDPTQRQTFHMKDLFDLFTLGSSEGPTETGEMFKGTETQLNNEYEADSSATRDVENGSRGSFTALARKELMNNASWGGTPGPKTSYDDIPWGGESAPSPFLDGEKETTGNGDVSNITGVASVEEFREDPATSKPSSAESRILEGIFARSGVHSVLQHDQIINGKRVISADRTMLEREAKRVAAEAAAELRRAGEAARNIPIGTVTWTGEIGEAGRPPNIRRGAGPSSSGILSSLAARQGLTPGSASGSSSRSGTPSSADRVPRGKDFLKLIRDYIRRQGGSVPSQMLVVHFNSMCKTNQQTEEFKAMLFEVATLKKGTGTRMRGKWELKDEYM